MTNLSTMSSQSWLTRGRLLVGLPLGLGVLVSVAVVVLGVRPLLQTVQGLEERRDTLLGLQSSLPALERQLSQAEVELRVAVEKQALLLGLLAGRNKVQTFLALLNQQALASGVQMQRYEPLKTPPPTQGQSRRNNNSSNAKQQQDPWKALGYRKSSVALGVSGSFGGLQTFLQRMEALALLVESSELQLKAVVETTDAESAGSVVAPTQLTMKLSFYDVDPMLDVPPTGSTSSSS